MCNPDVLFLQFPASDSDFSVESLEIESQRDYSSVLSEILQGGSDEPIRRYLCRDFN